MHLFCVKPTIHRFSTLAEFLSSFSVGQGDLLLTEQVLFRQYLEGRPLTCSVVIKDQYGLGEPKEEVIDAILRDIACLSIRRIIAMGGGSVIDIAKILCVKDAYPCRRVIEMQIPMELDKELIVLPTTCGTGSEVTFGGIVTMKDTGLKTGVLAQELSASHAVLIPELLTTLPRWVMVHCSVDALGHSMESFVSPVRGNEFARAAGSRSIRLLMDGYLHLLQDAGPPSPALLEQFLTASCLAGIAVNNGGAGPVHALAYPIGELYKVSHGETIYQFLIAVFSYYEQTADGPLLEELRQLLTPVLQQAGLFTGAVFANLGALLGTLCPLKHLRDYGVRREDIHGFVDSIFQTKQRLLSASYVPFEPEAAAELYRQRL